MVTTGKCRSELRKAALTAGISLLIMTLAASFSYGFVHGSLVVLGDASATLQKLTASTTLFKAEIFGWIITLLCDIVVAWAFYVYLKPVNQHLAQLAAWLRLVYATILGIAILNLVFVLLLTNRSDLVSLFPIDQLSAQVMLYLQAFDSIWSIGLVVFGAHLLIVGYLAFQAKTVPKLIGVLLMIASIGYLSIHLCKTFLQPDAGVITVLEYVFNLPMIVGELGFGLWLLVKGGKGSSKG